MKIYITLILLKLRFFVLKMLQRIRNLCGPKTGEAMLTGELVVTKEGEVEILLKGSPSSVKVFFDDDVIVVPCDPHHHDTLHWHVKNLHQHHRHDHWHDHCGHEDKFALIIKWHVHNLRIIKWVIEF